MTIKRLYISFILILIISSGIFKDHLLYAFADFISWVGVDSGTLSIEEVHQFVSSTTSKEVFHDKNVGLILYYPLYLSLHFWFIAALFSASKNRKRLMLFLAILFVVIIAGRLISGMLGWLSFRQFFTHLLKSIFGMPFILLFIEGGRIVVKDIRRHLSEN